LPRGGKPPTSPKNSKHRRHHQRGRGKNADEVEGGEKVDPHEKKKAGHKNGKQKKRGYGGGGEAPENLRRVKNGGGKGKKRRERKKKKKLGTTHSNFKADSPGGGLR